MRRSSTTSIPIIQPSSLRSTSVMLSACLPVRSRTCRRAAFTACLAVRDGAALRRTAPSPVPAVPVPAAAGHGPVRPGGLGLALLGLIPVPHRFVVVTPSRFELIRGWLVAVLVLLGRFELIPGRLVLVVSGRPGLAGSQGGLRPIPAGPPPPGWLSSAVPLRLLLRSAMPVSPHRRRLPPSRHGAAG